MTGYATPVEDPEGYASRLRPWVAQTVVGALRITPDLVTGFRLAADQPEPLESVEPVESLQSVEMCGS